MDELVNYLGLFDRTSFVTGLYVAILQIIVVYCLVELFILMFQRRAEARKWREARMELDAYLLSQTYYLTYPLNHYVDQYKECICLRKNYPKCLVNVSRKSRDLDAMLAIFSGRLAPKSFTKINQLADQLRLAASEAEDALCNWNIISKKLPIIGDGQATNIYNFRIATKPIAFESSENPTENAEMNLGHHTLQVIHQVSQIAEQLIEVSQSQFSLDELNTTFRYKSSPESAHRECNYAKKYIEQLKSLTAFINTHSVGLVKTSEKE